MNVTVMSRQDAIKYCYQPHSQRVIMISISDPYETYMRGPFSSHENGVAAVMSLAFADAEVPGKDVYYREVGEEDLISQADAKKIRDFLQRYPDTDVIVHCDAGISRSAGVGAAILKWATGSDFAIFDNLRYRPNMRCYRTVLMELMDQMGPI